MKFLSLVDDDIGLVPNSKICMEDVFLVSIIIIYSKSLLKTTLSLLSFNAIQTNFRSF